MHDDLRAQPSLNADSEREQREQRSNAVTQHLTEPHIYPKEVS